MPKTTQILAIAILATFSLVSLEANYVEENFTCKVNNKDIEELNKNLKDPSFPKERKANFKIALASAKKAKAKHGCK